MLPAKIRRALVVWLHDVEGMTFRAIGRELGICRMRAYKLYQEGWYEQTKTNTNKARQ